MRYFVICNISRGSFPLCLMDHNGGVISFRKENDEFDRAAYSERKYATRHAQDMRAKYKRDKFLVVNEDGLKRLMIQSALDA